MDILDLSNEKSKVTIAPGTILILQGKSNKAISILHSGLAEILFNEKNSPDSTPEEIINNSLRVGLIKGESPFGVVGAMDRDVSSTISIRTVTECIVSSRPVETVELISKIQSDFSFNFKMLRTLIIRIESTFYLFNNYKYLWHKFASIADSIALGTNYRDKAKDKKSDRKNATLEQYTAYLMNSLKEKKQPQSTLWDYNLFLGKLQDQLELYSDHDSIIVEDLFDYKQFLFIKRLIRKKDDVLKAIFQKDEPMNFYVFEFLERTLEIMVKNNMKLASEINDLVYVLYGDNGWIKKITLENDLENAKVRDFFHFLAKFSWRCKKDTLNLLGKDLSLEFPVFISLKKFRNISTASPEKSISASNSNKKPLSRLLKYKGLMRKILDFSDLPKEFTDSFTFLMEKLSSQSDVMSSEPEVVKLRNEISKKYWYLYEVCFLKFIDSDLKGFIPGIMLHFGLVDETLVSKEELMLIDDFYTRNLYSDDSIPVMTLPYFLEKIYRSEINPSITDMGETFHSTIKAQQKMTDGQMKGKYLFENTAEDRVRYEIRKISQMLTTVLAGGKNKSLPILCSALFSGNMKRFFLEPDSLVVKIEKYKNRDFSLFYREVMLKHDQGTDFIHEETFPYFVLYPALGSRGLLWQELDGTKKNSPGRFFFPLFFLEKINETLLYQLGSFRWELHKTIAGYNWTDPVDGGLVGAYYDYIQFYKKNPSITSEAKNRLAEFIKKTKSDKDRFARDYMTWIEYEFDGKIRLNSAAREIFYRFCPFLKNIREVQAKKPLYESLDNRFNKRRDNEILKIQSRMLKYEKKNKAVPVQFFDYMKYLEM